MTIHGILFGMIFPLAVQASQAGSNGRPLPPEFLARKAEVTRMRNEAQAHEQAGRVEQALQLLKDACALDNVDGFSSGTSYMLAKMLVRAGREEEALAAFRRSFKWKDSWGDLEVNGPPLVPVALDYALLLSKRGKVEEAKAIYYYALRHHNDESRSREPVPFLVVFDPDPEGIYWEYSPERFRAAALILYERHTSGTRHLLEEARNLAPDWFYPVLLKADVADPGKSEPLLQQAEALAKPGLEREMMARYRVQLAEHYQWVEAMDYVAAPDTRPMREGNERRARMTVIRPNEALLKRLSLGGSG